MATLGIGILVSPIAISTAISGGGFIMSLLGAAFIAGLRWGTVKTRLELLEKTIERGATKEELQGVKEDLAEIKGMFRMTLKDS